MQGSTRRVEFDSVSRVHIEINPIAINVVIIEESTRLYLEHWCQHSGIPKGIMHESDGMGMFLTRVECQQTVPENFL